MKELNFKVNKFVSLSLYQSYNKVNFYTFQFEGDEMTETEKFFTKFEKEEQFSDDLNNMAVWLFILGQRYSAKKEFFRFEGAASALPPPKSKMINEVIVNDLRLYCLRISDKIVILANGGIKSSQTVQGSPDLMPHFRFVNVMSKQVDEFIKDGTFKVEGKNILELDKIEFIY
jgi:hypothetical protein